MKPKSLSKKSLELVFDWAEKNETADILAQAYLSACSTLGACKHSEMSDRLCASHKRRTSDTYYRCFSSAHSIENLAYDIRDAIGREILGVLKRS